MMCLARLGAVCLACAVFSLGAVAPLGAHRLDEYLQAARLLVSTDRVHVEMDLTAGVAVAPAVFQAIDTDGNGDVSASEADAYGQQVLASIALALDDRPLRLRLDAREMPAPRDVREGTGVIRLRASADLPPSSPGEHHLFFRNTHRSEIGVYLANALVPDDQRIAITGQRRDEAQHELTIDYRVTAATSWPWTLAWPLAGGLAIVAGVALAVRARVKEG